jgi:hypothetical protein
MKIWVLYVRHDDGDSATFTCSSRELVLALAAELIRGFLPQYRGCSFYRCVDEYLQREEFDSALDAFNDACDDYRITYCETQLDVALSNRPHLAKQYESCGLLRSLPPMIEDQELVR